MAPASLTRISRAGFVNAYLVREDDGFTLVDTMLKGSGKRIRAAADQLGAPIVRIALTHAHGDHVGSVDELARALPGVELLISTRDARFLAKDMSLDPGEPQDKLRGGWPGTQTKPTRTFEPGDRIGSLEVVAAPGHTPGHVAFLDTRDRTLLCGDAYTTIGGVRTSAKPTFPFPLAAMSTWSRATELETAKALRALEPSRLAPGHGKVVDDPGAAMDAAIAKGA
jgi:glyoxylase-like metal-dependent hydrolase (beta-lactamase superfamily II)